ncbi:MAG: FkbM family methyltransferase [Pseudomonadota bacterium]
MTERPELHTFANGLTLPKALMLEIQLKRYATPESGNLHEPEEERWFERILSETPDDGGLFLDGGAALGYYSALVGRRKPEWDIWAFEPLDRFQAAIVETFRLNGLSTDRLRIDPTVLHTSEEEVSFADQAFGSTADQAMGERADMRQTRQGRPLSGVVREAGRTVTLLKLDIQGHELAVLDRARDVLSEGFNSVTVRPASRTMPDKGRPWRV